MPEGSFIKISYLVCESTQLSPQWGEIFEAQFDTVAVPDFFYAEVCRQSGVTIPIFVLPLALDLNPFLQSPPSKLQVNLLSLATPILSMIEKITIYSLGVCRRFWREKRIRIKTQL